MSSIRFFKKGECLRMSLASTLCVPDILFVCLDDFIVGVQSAEFDGGV